MSLGLGAEDHEGDLSFFKLLKGHCLELQPVLLVLDEVLGSNEELPHGEGVDMEVAAHPRRSEHLVGFVEGARRDVCLGVRSDSFSKLLDEGLAELHARAVGLLCSLGFLALARVLLEVGLLVRPTAIRCHLTAITLEHLTGALRLAAMVALGRSLHLILRERRDRNDGVVREHFGKLSTG